MAARLLGRVPFKGYIKFCKSFANIFWAKIYGRIINREVIIHYKVYKIKSEILGEKEDSIFPLSKQLPPLFKQKNIF